MSDEQYKLSDEEATRLLKIAGSNSDSAAVYINTADIRLHERLSELDRLIYAEEEEDFSDQPERGDPEWEEWNARRVESMNKADQDLRERKLRAQRNELLKHTDWYIQPDADLTEEDKTLVKNWRQALRDAPDSSVWPKELPLAPDVKGIYNIVAEIFNLQPAESVVEELEIPDDEIVKKFTKGGEQYDPDTLEKWKKSSEEKTAAFLKENKPQEVKPKTFKPLFNTEIVEEREIDGVKCCLNKDDVWVTAEEIESSKKYEEKYKAESKPKRARDENGKFIPDDPETPDYNEAWEGGKAPEK